MWRNSFDGYLVFLRECLSISQSGGPQSGVRALFCSSRHFLKLQVIDPMSSRPNLHSSNNPLGNSGLYPTMLETLLGISENLSIPGASSETVSLLPLASFLPPIWSSPSSLSSNWQHLSIRHIHVSLRKLHMFLRTDTFREDIQSLRVLWQFGRSSCKERWTQGIGLPILCSLGVCLP